MEKKTKIEIKLTPEEASAIIKDYLKKESNVIIKSVNFRITTEYSHQMDDHGTDVMSEVICTGEISGLRIPSVDDET